MADKETQPQVEKSTEPSVIPDQGGSAGKTAWPEVVGLTGEEAEKKIKEEMTGVRTFIVPDGSFMTMDYRTDRVRIFVDPSGVSSGEKSWPGVVGLTGEEAAKKIKKDMPRADTCIIDDNVRTLTCDYRTDRVRIFVDRFGKVVDTPTTG